MLIQDSSTFGCRFVRNIVAAGSSGLSFLLLLLLRGKTNRGIRVVVVGPDADLAAVIPGDSQEIVDLALRGRRVDLTGGCVALQRLGLGGLLLGEELLAGLPEGRALRVLAPWTRERRVAVGLGLVAGQFGGVDEGSVDELFGISGLLYCGKSDEAERARLALVVLHDLEVGEREGAAGGGGQAPQHVLSQLGFCEIWG